MSRTQLVWSGIAIVLIALMLAWLFLPVGDWVESFNAWLRGYGLLGMLIFVIVYIIAVVLMAPAGVMSVGAGMVFGGWGFPLVIVAATAGGLLAFLVGRYLTREWVQRLIRNKPVLAAVDKAVAEEGWKIVVLLRLTPLVPFNIQNYLFGATEVGLWPYVLGTFFGIMPGTALYVYLGAIGQATVSGETGGPMQMLFFGIGLVAAVAVVVVIGRKAKAKLGQVGIAEAGRS
jgi:uncharacterized membrane protein YdjX (TVP38/TMEM64 family)